MDKLELFSKCLNLVEGRENPESWWGWWNEHESEVEKTIEPRRVFEVKTPVAWIFLGTSIW